MLEQKVNHGLSDDNSKESPRSGQISKPGAAVLCIFICALLLSYKAIKVDVQVATVQQMYQVLLCGAAICAKDIFT